MFFLSLLCCATVYAKIELTPVRLKALDVQPRDVTSSQDGTMVFILAPGELVIYSSETDQIISRSAIDKAYDRISYSEGNKTLILSARSSNQLKILRVEQVFDIALSGLPFKGPLEAKVTIAIFDDYQ